MKILSYEKNNLQCLGILVENQLYDLPAADALIPADINDFLRGGSSLLERAKYVEQQIAENPSAFSAVTAYRILAPVPHPASCRDGYAFRQHVAAAWRNRGLDMLPEFDKYPVFYFTNHQAMYGPVAIACMPDHFHQLDFELEVAIVIGKKGRNIKAEDADAYIAGYMIMNDLSARTLQMEEMLLNLGPAKGKDFATAIGPWLVTPEELVWHEVAAKPGHTGKTYHLDMTCSVNGVTVSYGNLAHMDWTFAEIIERASYGCDLFPGDVIGSGTVGSGCFLELNGTALRGDPGHVPQWLQPGDVVELEVTGLGVLRNVLVAVTTEWSILDRKK